MGFRSLLFPVQWVYLAAISVRKLLYAIGLKRRHTFTTPIICVGNLSAGGTGKTPHTKYFSELLLRNGHQIAILLRGYKRKTKGFIHCNTGHSVFEIGDEAYEYVHGTDQRVNIFVCGQRRKGIRRIEKQFPETSVILMDDGFQHLSVKAGLNILLTDYLQPFYKDHLLPVGSLRELRSAKKRADIIIVSKTPKVFSPIIGRDLCSKIRPLPHQQVLFSYLEYNKPELVFADSAHKDPVPANIYTAFLVAGIANPYPLEEYIRRSCVELYTHSFPDHHYYSVSEIQAISEDFRSHLMKSKVLFTTEKDIPRLSLPEIKEKLIDLPLFFIPVKVGFHSSFNSEDIDKLILDYVRKNKKDS